VSAIEALLITFKMPTCGQVLSTLYSAPNSSRDNCGRETQ